MRICAALRRKVGRTASGGGTAEAMLCSQAVRTERKFVRQLGQNT